MDLLLFVMMVLALVFFAFKVLLWLLGRSVPFLFRKQLQRLEKDRLEGIERLRTMGINIKSANDDEAPKYYTSIY